MPDEKPGKALTGQVLPPARNEVHLPVNPPLSGIPLFNRMHYRAIERELAAYLSVLQTRNAVLREIGETVRIGEEYNRELVRTERLDDLRRIEGLKVDAELDAALENAIAQHDAAQINALRRRAHKADAEAEAIAAERRLAAMKSPTSPPPPSAAERVKAEMARLRQQEKTLIDALLDGCAREEDAPEEVREIIRDVRLATRHRIATLIDELSQ